MASFPTAKHHRTSRRKLGRGQSVNKPAATATFTDSADTVIWTFSQPVVISGPIPANVSGGRTLVSQSQTSPTTVSQTYSGTLTTQTFSIVANDPSITTVQGGGFAGLAGTFT